jgi:aldehyde:ferredoxin oxidoreductase
MLQLHGVDTYNQAVKLFDLVNRYGLDSFHINPLFEFLGQMYERGIIKKEDLGFEWKRDFNTLQHLVEIIAKREGFGNVIAEGWNRLAEINEIIENEKLTVKGMDIFADPRFARLGTMEFEQVVNPRGAQVSSGGSPTFPGAGGTLERFKIHFGRMGIPETAFERLFSPPRKDMGINVGRLTRYAEDLYTVLTNLGLCARPQLNRFWGLESTTAFYNAVTGFDMTQEDMRMAAERTWNLLKLLNVKEGFSRKDDVFPKEWFNPLKHGNIEFEFKGFFGETIITPNIANQLLDDYYDERGWNKESGIPTQEKVIELGLEKYV